jgi:TetR/AcrR family transcriptional repressor of nem operon
MEERPRSREEAKRETREALLRAGIAEFSERGLAEPSLDAICSRAGYTRGAFYVHFRDRDDFISAVMEQVLGDFLDAIIATGDQERDLEHTVTRFTDALAAATRGLPHLLLGGLAPAGQQRLQFHRVLEASARSPGVRERFSALLRGAIDRVAKAAGEGQVSGTVRTDVESELVGALLVALALGSVNALEIGISFDPGLVREAVISLLRPRDD